MPDDPKTKLKNQLNILLQEALDSPANLESNKRDSDTFIKGSDSLGDERGGGRSNELNLPRRLAESNRDAMISDVNESGSIEDIDPNIESIRHSSISPIPDSINPSSNVVPIKPGTENYFPSFGQITPSQIRRCLTEHPDMVGLIRFDNYKGDLVKAKIPPWKSNSNLWSDVDTEQLKCWLSDRFNIVYPTSSLDGVLSVVGQDNEYNSLQEEISSYKWDGIERVDSWVVDYLQAEGTDYHKEVGKRWLISAIARAMDPGCKADHVLVLEGWQGAFKSQAIEALAGTKNYSDSPIDLNSSFAPQQLVGVWVYELPELVLKKTFGNDKYKAFLSQKQDHYSPKHMRRKIYQPRNNVFAASTNDSIHSDDATGDRRSWSIFIENNTRCKISLIDRDRHLLIAEAYQMYLKYEENKRNGVSDFENPFVWWLNKQDMEDTAREEQDKRYLADVWEEAISQWIGKNFDSIMKRGYVTVSEILFSALKIKPKDWKRSDEMRISKILTSRFNWKKGNRIRTDSGRVYPYMPPDLG